MMVHRAFSIAKSAFMRLLPAWVLPAWVLLAAGFAMPAHGAKLVIRLQAANPADEPRPVEFRASLPARVTPDDILDLGGLELGYDVKSDSYHVHGTQVLGPREIAVREVQVNDIWVLDEGVVGTMETRAGQMVQMLEGTRHEAEAAERRDRVVRWAAQMLARQRENRISAVSPMLHIQAYEANLKAFQEVRQEVGQIENLVLAAGMNPGDTLIGDDRGASVPRRDAHAPEAYGEATVLITVRNSSATQARKIKFKRELPPEVTLDDVLDADGLSVRYDAQARQTSVSADNLEIGPLETRTFSVRIRDKWNINGPRMEFLQGKLDMLRTVTAGRAGLSAVRNTLDQAQGRLSAVAAETGPGDFTPAYIAFYRRQADRLDVIERDLNRIDAALKPLETKRGFDIPAPDKKTTWLIIYSILGFLALISLLFFLRWYVRSS